MKVGFVFIGARDNGWLGGSNYFENLFRAIASLKEPEIELVAFTAQKDTPVPVGLKSKPIAASLAKRNSVPWLLRCTIRTATSRDWIFESYLRYHDIQVLSHAQDLGIGSRIATLGWIPDFQHLYLPELFSKEQIEGRDRLHKRLCARCDRVIVSSECARRDLSSFLPQYSAKARVLQFVAAPESTSQPTQLSDLETKYSFNRPFFLLPNGFWAHKNHRVVISALNILKRQGKELLILATGNTENLHNPAFFPALMDYARECDVLSHFRVLGVIPQDDLTTLMHCSIALINPSRFEGWSTSVEESKSLGKRILLSDIPVHREQSPALGIYFNLDDAEELAQRLLDCHSDYQFNEDINNQRQARLLLPGRQKTFARTYQSLVSDAADTKKTISAKRFQAPR